MNFDPVARPYRWLERLTFGGALQRCRVALIDHTRNARNVLILGEGDGRFLEKFLRVNSQAKITVIDSSGEMIRLASRRIGKTNRVKFLQNDVRDAGLPDEKFDLIVTNFFLDCFDRSGVENVVEIISTKLANGGQWLWSDFAIPAAGFGRLPARIVVGGLYWFFRRTTQLEADSLIDPTPMFRLRGFESVDEASLRGGLLKSVLWRKAATGADPHAGLCD
jgi:SAM-dependent methyltransferase